MALDSCGGLHKKELICVLLPVSRITYLYTQCFGTIDSYANDQSKVEPYGVQVVKHIEAFLQRAVGSITLNPHPYKVPQ